MAGLLGGSPSPTTECKGQKNKAEAANKNQKGAPGEEANPEKVNSTCLMVLTRGLLPLPTDPGPHLNGSKGPRKVVEWSTEEMPTCILLSQVSLL